MRSFLMTLHVMTCLSLIVAVLLQRGKGADMGAMLGGGGSQTMFGARGAGNFLTKLTTGCAVVFMITSLSLSYLATQDSDIAIFDEEAVEQPVGELEEIGEVVVEDDASSTTVGLDGIGDAPEAGGLEEVGEAIVVPDTVDAPAEAEPATP